MVLNTQGQQLPVSYQALEVLHACLFSLCGEQPVHAFASKVCVMERDACLSVESVASGSGQVNVACRRGFPRN
jgi:hypothetical protein